MGMCLAVGLPSGSSHLVVGMQLSMSVFVVHGATAAQQRQLRESAAAEAEARKVAEAARLGLAWPRPGGRRRRGPPSRQDKRVGLLYTEINKGCLVPEGLTASVPGWWSPGHGLIPAVDAMSAELASITVGAENACSSARVGVCRSYRC